MPSTRNNRPYTPTQLTAMRGKMNEVCNLIGLELWVQRANEEETFISVDTVKQFVDGQTDELDFNTLRALAKVAKKTAVSFLSPSNEEFLDAMTARLWRDDKTLKDIGDYRIGKKSIISVENTKGEYEETEVQGVDHAILPVMMLRSLVDEVHNGTTSFTDDVSEPDILHMIQLLSSRVKRMAKPDEEVESDIPDRSKANGHAAYSTERNEALDQQPYYKAAKTLLNELSEYARKELTIDAKATQKAQNTPIREEYGISIIGALSGYGGVQPSHEDMVLEKVSAEQERGR